ncbi:MAG: hypothetical protein ACTTGJ_02875 [Clostridium sp.]
MQKTLKEFKEIVEILKLLSHLVCYDERSEVKIDKNIDSINSYEYILKILEKNNYNMYILNSYEICNIIKEILSRYDKKYNDSEYLKIVRTTTSYNLKTSYLKIKIMNNWYVLDFANCIYELRLNTRPLFFLVNDDTMERFQNILYDEFSVDGYNRECISIYNFENVLEEKYHFTETNIKESTFRKMRYRYLKYSNIYEKILLQPWYYSNNIYLKYILNILKEKRLYNPKDVMKNEIALKEKFKNVPYPVVKEVYYDILDYIALPEEEKEKLEYNSVFISFKDYNNVDENIENILKDNNKKEQLLKYIDKIAHIQFKIYSVNNYVLGMLDDFKTDSKNRKIDINIYIYIYRKT